MVEWKGGVEGTVGIDQLSAGTGGQKRETGLSIRRRGREELRIFGWSVWFTLHHSFTFWGKKEKKNIHTHTHTPHHKHTHTSLLCLHTPQGIRSEVVQPRLSKVVGG